ncbi:MAG: sigma 54-interacting transcriptional regulator [Saprospiraceae bacterium]|nr:sigma 54-interacting transcriptional regulator [Saprospiraceae bacterium]
MVQEREIIRVGGNKPIPVDIRLITATHKDLADEVKSGRFREDLFFRIVGFRH